MVQSKLNTHFAHILFATLKAVGIDDIFMAPGSRSSPLSLAAHHYACNFVTHFDERSLCFMALGKIKADLKPAVVITTSGSAVGNLLPAVMEAFMQKLPLLLITADRPQELHHRGSNQTIKQADIFAPFTVLSTSFDPPRGDFNDRALSSLISFFKTKLKQGPIHLNIPLHEPLFDESVNFPHDITFKQELEDLASLDLNHKKGLIILGEGGASNRQKAQFFDQLSQHLDAPIIADITSNFRSYGFPSISYYPLFIEKLPLEFDYILHFGTKITSKSLETFIKNFQGAYYHFDDSDSLYDPYYKISATFRLSFTKWQELLQLKTTHSHTLCSSLYSLNQPLAEAIAAFCDRYPSHEEGMYITPFTSIPDPTTQLFIGNSLPIRHMDALFFPTIKAPHIHTQRGVSGIDGLISTACGLSLNGSLTLALLGDLSSLYDLNALSLIRKNRLPLVPIVFNNHGGGIFSYLPIAKQTEHFDTVIATEHQFDFKALAHGFELDHILISSVDELILFLKNPTPYCFLEIVSNREQNPHFFQKIKEHVYSFILPVLKQLTSSSLCPST